MNSTQLQTIQICQDYIKDLHNHSKFVQHRLFNRLKLSPQYTLIIKLMNHCINNSVQNIQSIGQVKQNYFEESKFIIKKQVRNIGILAKYLGAYCQFQSSFQTFLAQYEIVEFWRLYEAQNPDYIDYIKGIFPYINVHRDNIPMYTPFYEVLQSYKEIGNPNWQFSREYLDKVYRGQILAISDEQENWYLLILGNKKLLEKYNENPVQKIWASLYYYYINETLKPYRQAYNENSMEEQETINLLEIKSLISQQIRLKSVSLQMKAIFSLILYILNEENYTNLSECYTISNSLLQKQANDTQNLITCGLINTQFYQLCRNQLQFYNKSNENNREKYQLVKNILKSSTDQNKIFLKLRLPFSDFYSRIIYPNIIRNGQLIQDGNLQLLELYTELVRDSSAQDPYPFPKYPYDDTTLNNKLVDLYLEHYPDQLLQYIHLIPSKQAIWKLLKAHELNNAIGFQRIKQLLSKRKHEYFLLIQQKDAQAHKDDLNRFIQIWNRFHQFIQQNKNFNLIPVNHAQKILYTKAFISMIRNYNFIASEIFKQQVLIPFKNRDNIIKVLKILLHHITKYLENSFNEQNENDRQLIINECNSLIAESWFNEQILDRLTQEQRNEFHQAWTIVQLSDPDIITDLICTETKNNEQKTNQPQHTNHTKSSKNNYYQMGPEILELD